MENGWIKLHRKIIKTSWYKRSSVKSLAIHLMLIAHWQESKTLLKRQEKMVEIGQVVTSQRKLSKESGLSRQQVRTALELLSNTDFLTHESTSEGSIITIKKYSHYQSTEEIQPTNQPTGNPRVTHDQPTGNPRLRIKELKKERIKEEDQEHCASAKPAETLFSIFWSNFPSRNGKKTGKSLAFTEWQKLKVDETLLQVILQSLKKQVEHKQQCDSQKIFCAELPDACRWLKRREWETEIKENIIKTETQRIAENEQYKRDTEAAAKKMFGGA
jgi:hypothetical protein